MLPIVLGFFVGLVVPVQTSINSRLRGRLGSPYLAALASFIVAFLFLLILLPVTGQEASLPLGRLSGEPVWIWAGGVCGIIYLTGNILLFGKLGSVQTVVLPVAGQILMGLIIDHFGLFHSAVTEISLLRAAGACLVFAGVIIVTLSKAGSASASASAGRAIWLWRLFGIGIGMLLAIQAAVNGYMGRLTGSPVKASMISFAVGSILMLVLCLIRKEWQRLGSGSGGRPWWIWTGGVLGGIYNLANVYLTHIIGTGMTVIILLTGTTAGGLAVDHLGLFGTPRNPVDAGKLLGIAMMIAGSVAIRMF